MMGFWTQYGLRKKVLIGGIEWKRKRVGWIWLNGGGGRGGSSRRLVEAVEEMEAVDEMEADEDYCLLRCEPTYDVFALKEPKCPFFFDI
jgi:hypothetical protein